MNLNRDIHINWKSKKVKYFIIFLILAVLSVGIYFFFFRNTFSTENVVVKIDTSKEASSGEEISWIVSVKNNSNIEIQNINLNFEYPSGTFDKEGSIKKREEIQINSILPQQEKTENFSGVVFGKKNEKKEPKASITYNPRGFSTEFQNETTAVTIITNSLITFNMKIPEKVDKGQEFTIVLSWQSGFSSPLENVQVKLSLPDGFIRTSGITDNERPENVAEGEETFQSKIIFDVGTLNEGEGQKVEIKGKLSGEIDDEKMFKAEIGKFDEELYEFIPLALKESSVKIISSTIEVFRKINGQANYFPVPGEKLSYIVTFKNAGEEIYRDMSLTVELESDYIDFSTLKCQGGQVSGNKIIFSSENIPELLYLGPYDEGNVGFSVDVKKGILASNASIIEKIKINKVKKQQRTKISSQSSFYQYAYYHLPASLRGKVTTGGNFPIAENKETTLIIHWKAKNRGNNLQNAKITGTLGENVTWTGKVYAPGAKFFYDKKTKRVTLILGNMSYNYSKDFAFQIKIKPKKLPQDLITGSKFSGKDSWTGQTFENLSPSLSTDSIE